MLQPPKMRFHDLPAHVRARIAEQDDRFADPPQQQYQAPMRNVTPPRDLTLELAIALVPTVRNAAIAGACIMLAAFGLPLFYVSAFGFAYVAVGRYRRALPLEADVSDREWSA